MTVRTLTGSPALAPLFVRAALTRRALGGDLPDLGLRREGVVVDRDHLLRYQRVCGFTGSDVLPHTYPHVLGFPLQVALMTDRSFPLPLPGLVHLENQITVHRRLTADDRLEVSVRAQDLRPHARGRLVDLLTEVRADGVPVWQGRSTYLHRGGGSGHALASQVAPPLPDVEPSAVIAVPEGQGRAYAAVSGDVNPIHLHALSARAMGFPRAIAHGMWTAARTLAVLGARAQDASSSQVWFAKPVFLPSIVELVVEDAGSSVLAGLRSAREPAKTHLTMTLRSGRTQR